MNTNQTIAQAVAVLIRDGYVFPEVADRIYTYVVTKAEGGTYDHLTADNFADVLTKEIRRLSGDSHLRVCHTHEAHVPEESGDVVREQNDRAEHCRQITYGIDPVERTSTDVAILRIRELVEPDLSRQVFESALDSLADAKALIIDLRSCVGGDPDTVALVCSHLVDKRTQLSSVVPRAAPEDQFWAEPSVYGKRFGGEKPLLVVVANFTFSGAEMLAYDLQTTGRATVVGAITGGGANPCAFHWPSPHFNLLLPGARSVNPITGSNWEGHGVVPHIICREDEALFVAIELAEQRIGDI